MSNDDPIEDKNASINSHQRIDVNVLMAKLRVKEKQNTKKNLIILVSLVLVIGSLGVYLSE
tara:strand:+ start:245 stop:427 length:183 start_codon:yes stop_codon:yes gene_type:complete